MSGIKKYRKKPIVIEAIQFDGNNYDETMKFGDNNFMQPFFVKNVNPNEINGELVNDPTIFIKTLEGNMRISVGDYVIKGIKGEYYPCKPDIFLDTYDLAD